jgi:hypothetical protein
VHGHERRLVDGHQVLVLVQHRQRHLVDLFEGLAPQRDALVRLHAIVGAQGSAVGGVRRLLDDGSGPSTAGVAQLGAHEYVQPHARALGRNPVDLQDGVFVDSGGPYRRSLGERRLARHAARTPRRR